MPLVRGTAPKTPHLRFASQFETHFLWEVTATRTRNRHVSVWLTDAELLRELSAIGNNINQIAHTVNGQKYAADSQIDHAVALVRRAWRLVKDSF